MLCFQNRTNNWSLYPNSRVLKSYEYFRLFLENVVIGLRFPLQLKFPKSEYSRPCYGQIIYLGFWGNFDNISPKPQTFFFYTKTPQLRTTNQITITNNTNHIELIFKGVPYLFLGHPQALTVISFFTSPFLLSSLLPSSFFLLRQGLIKEMR